MGDNMYAIIDNSTLTAVQRLMGEIPIRNKNTIDGDILCLETFVQTVLFYDDVFFMDDYKPEFKSNREKYFKYIYPIELDENTHNALLQETKKLTDDFVPQVKKRKFDNDTLKEFFDMLRMNITFTWDLSSSVFYLKHKLLEEQCGVDIPKYSKLAEMIFSQMKSGEPTSDMDKKRAEIYDSKGNLITDDYVLHSKEGHSVESEISAQTDYFMAGLSWLDFRTTYYTLLAKHQGFDLVLHPIRNAYEIALLRKYSSHPQSARVLLSEIDRLSQEAFTKINSYTQPVLLKSQLPMLSLWLVKNGGMNNFMDTLYTLKGEKEFIRAREILNNLDSIHQEENNQKYITTANNLILDFSRQMNNLMERYGVIHYGMNPTSSLIKVYNLSTIATELPTLPVFNSNIKKPGILSKMRHYSGFGATYKAIIDDLTSIERLGAYHDMLCSNVRYTFHAGTYNLDTEKSIYANAECYWKIPL